MTKAARIAWPAVVARAREFVESRPPGMTTLRAVFYRLVIELLLPNTDYHYKHLSNRTADARRETGFPDLFDRGRSIHRYTTFASPEEALERLARSYRRDRTEGQDVSLYLGVEKAGHVAGLLNRFGDLGIPILGLGGYASQSYINTVVNDAEDRGRPSILLYAGDFDPSGEDIIRDFVERTDCFDKVVRIALTADQVVEYRLPPLPGKTADTRAARFIERHGELMQVELDALDALDGDVLHGLYADAITEFWDVSEYEAVVEREAEERLQLLSEVGS